MISLSSDTINSTLLILYTQDYSLLWKLMLTTEYVFSIQQLLLTIIIDVESFFIYITKQHFLAGFSISIQITLSVTKETQLLVF